MTGKGENHDGNGWSAMTEMGGRHRKSLHHTSSSICETLWPPKPVHPRTPITHKSVHPRNPVPEGRHREPLTPKAVIANP